MSIKQAGSFGVKKGKILTKDHFLKMPPLIQGVIYIHFGSFAVVAAISIFTNTLYVQTHIQVVVNSIKKWILYKKEEKKSHFLL